MSNQALLLVAVTRLPIQRNHYIPNPGNYAGIPAVLLSYIFFICTENNFNLPY